MAYLRLSENVRVNSDSSNILLMGWDLLHGNLLLHGWYMSDVSFPTELPQYALLEDFLRLHTQTAHVAAAMTHTGLPGRRATRPERLIRGGPPGYGR